MARIQPRWFLLSTSQTTIKPIKLTSIHNNYSNGRLKDTFFCSTTNLIMWFPPSGSGRARAYLNSCLPRKLRFVSSICRTAFLVLASSRTRAIWVSGGRSPEYLYYLQAHRPPRFLDPLSFLELNFVTRTVGSPGLRLSQLTTWAAKISLTKELPCAHRRSVLWKNR